jgi:hypothetical protein
MFKIYDFRCTNGHVFEEMVESGITTSRCGCGANATNEGHSGDFPGRHMKWVKEHEQAGRKKPSP